MYLTVYVRDDLSSPSVCIEDDRGNVVAELSAGQARGLAADLIARAEYAEGVSA